MKGEKWPSGKGRRKIKKKRVCPGAADRKKKWVKRATVLKHGRKEKERVHISDTENDVI